MRGSGGHSSTYIAKQLFISENTARNHMKNIYRKACVSSKEELLERLDQEATN